MSGKGGELISMVKYQIDQLVFGEFLPEMFKRVGLKSSDINDLTKQPQWFLSKSWTKEDEDEFVAWLVKRLQHKLRMSKKLAEKEARMFVFNYGWTTNQEKQGELDL